MNRLLPTGFLLLATAAAAQAQQADTLAAHLADIAAVIAVVPALRVSDPMQPTVATARNLPGLTTMQSLLSQVAGVQVTPYSGAPGAWAAVRIRGVSSVTSPSQPLYVVDDVPGYSTDPTPEAWASMRTFFTSPAFRAETPFTSGGNPLLDLPVEDVATVEVLQDAAATARYGLQGGNGVVRITTRRGAAGQPGPQPVRVRYAGYVGVQQVRQRYAVLDGPQFAALANQAWTNSGRTGLLYSAEEVRSRGNVNWQDELFRTGISTGHTLSLDGNTRTPRYYVAADYLNQNGVLKGSSLTHYSLRANVDQQVTARGSLGLKVAGSQIDQRYPGFDPDAGRLLQNALQEVPLGTKRDAQGLPFTSDPVQTAGAVRGTPRTRRLLAQLSATYQLRARPDVARAGQPRRNHGPPRHLRRLSAALRRQYVSQDRIRKGGGHRHQLGGPGQPALPAHAGRAPRPHGFGGIPAPEVFAEVGRFAGNGLQLVAGISGLPRFGHGGFPGFHQHGV